MIVQSLLRLTAGYRYCQASWSQTAAAASRSFSTISGDADKDVWERIYRREVPRTMQELGDMLGKEVDSPPDAQILKIAIVGVPNSGKSTLINGLLRWKVFSVSSKVHTTQVNARGVLIDESTQLVFLDTPGLVTPQEVSRHRLKRTLLSEAELSLQEVDLMAVVHDVSDHFTRNYLHPRVLRLLALHPTIPSILLLNKVDKSKCKQSLLDITRNLTEGFVGGQKSHLQTKGNEVLDKKKLITKTLLHEKKNEHEAENANVNSEKRSQVNERTITEVKDMKETNEMSDSQVKYIEPRHEISKSDVLEGRVQLTEHQLGAFLKKRKSWPKFEEVFMISALDGTGVDDLRDFLLASAQPGPWIYSSQVVTDQNPQEIALLTVREKFLDTFPRELPYTLNFSIDYWDLSESEVVNIVVRVGCQRRGLVSMVVGGGGKSVANLARKAEQDLRNTFRTEVRLRLNIVYDSLLKKKVYK